ncbi:Shedu anti-phage system protein SduA domain-containing protein [Planctomycetes bacterium TBK1r]|uniref:Shedu protein SduA C-terminal domain-containing protein n=1 Tax=Stieleria magnilauensis TaxID=2527963 RepID=A0ABX5XI45_9BACT|nr:hypothetical protein TBK1r_05770 [Planctomycetes bacterium TBK1r]
MTISDQTYEIEKGPPAIDFRTYKENLLVEYRALLDSAEHENELQDFLERHPSLVPGAFTPGNQSGHSPRNNALFSQPKLPGFGGKVPDFLWLSGHSSCDYAALIEIECPTKKLFTNDGQQRAEFSQAYNQIKDWRIWFETSANKQIFFDHYGLSGRYRFSRAFDLHFILIYGRRSEFQDNPSLSIKRNSLMSGRNEELISFDRLMPHDWLESATTVVNKGMAELEVKFVPETFLIHPWDIRYQLEMKGLADAIQGNPRIDASRREFLLRRLVYWREWKERTKDSSPIMKLSDFE